MNLPGQHEQVSASGTEGELEQIPKPEIRKKKMLPKTTPPIGAELYRARQRNLHIESSTTTAKNIELPLQTDVILAMQEPYMQQITTCKKTYEFRKYCLMHSINRIWFYRIAPYSSIEYICEIEPAKTRNPGDTPLEGDGFGNKQYNERDKDFEGFDFAYKILSVYQLENPITLDDLKSHHGLQSTPRGITYVPPSLMEVVDWRKGRKLR